MGLYKLLLKNTMRLRLLFPFFWDMLWVAIYKRSMKHCGKGVLLEVFQQN